MSDYCEGHVYATSDKHQSIYLEESSGKRWSVLMEHYDARTAVRWVDDRAYVRANGLRAAGLPEIMRATVTVVHPVGDPVPAPAPDATVCGSLQAAREAYAADVAAAKRVVALDDSLNNGAIREERGEGWYHSQAATDEINRNNIEMGICLPRIMDYVAALEADNAALREQVATLTAALEVAQGSFAVIAVEGVGYSSIRAKESLKQIERLLSPPPADYKAARGAFAWHEGDEPAEDTVRRIRGDE